MIALSHRGYWKTPDERNTLAAFERSFLKGFGTETDVRDNAGKLVISHDPPAGDEITFDEFLGLHRRFEMNLPLALNIKADGLQSLMARALAQYRPSNYFVFDMSIPDTAAWIRAEIPVFVRHSDIERQPCFYEAAAGIWMDGIESDWITDRNILAHLDAGKRVCIVSPELHGRAPEQFWTRLAVSNCRDSDGLMLCTDRPSEAQHLIGEELSV